MKSYGHVAGTVTILLLCCFCSMVFAQQVQVVPIIPTAPSVPGAKAASGSGLPTGLAPVPPQAPASVPSLPSGQIPPTPGGASSLPYQLPSTTGSTIQQVSPAPVQPPGQASIGQPAPVPQQFTEPLTSFEAYIRSGVPGPLSFDISQFGYQLFMQPPSTFVPLENIPVEPTYVIGPGDEIRISVWGNIDGQWTVRVDRNGEISLPRVGTVGVAGLTFEQLKSTLLKEFKKYFTDFEMNISMGQLRAILVYVVGNARKPGAYSVSSMSTLLNALFESGGPDKNGTMRDIQLKRGGKTIVHFDLYNMLLKGDKTRDVRLMPGDVIFIPGVGALVGIAGEVQQPAIYELTGPSRLLDLIRMAGGLKSLAFKGRFQVQRIMDHKFINLVEGDLVDLQKYPDKNIALQDGDLVKIYPVAEMKYTVNLAGAVLIPGEYGVAPGVTTVKEVLERAGGLRPYASDQGELTRLTITQNGPITTVATFDAKRALLDDPAHNVTLQEYDYLLVRTVPDWQLLQTVSIGGEVQFPATYAVRKGEKLSSVLTRAGGYTDKAYLKGGVFKRQSVKALQQKQLLKMVNRLETELFASATADVSSALTIDEAKIYAEENRQKRGFVENLRQVEAQGRTVIQF